jgi:2-keto-4-pentenoate hydratase
MLPLNLHTVAHEMKTAQDLSRQIEPFTSRVSEFDNSAAYEVARLVHEARIREGALPAGRKIGFSNRDMWPAYRVSEPIWAYVYDTTVVRLSGPRAVCRIGKFTEARIEPEIVLHFHAVPPVDDDPTQMLACID